MREGRCVDGYQQGAKEQGPSLLLWPLSVPVLPILFAGPGCPCILCYSCGSACTECRLALERATTAAEAVDVVTSLLEAHGQGGPCEEEGGLGL